MSNTVETVVTLNEKKYKKMKKIADAKQKSVSKLIEEKIDEIDFDSICLDDKPEFMQSGNPLSGIIGICDTGLGDASVNHDKYLYGKGAK